MPFMFEKLQVYQKAIAFADDICTLTRSFPRGYFFLADQLNRAALSIAALYWNLQAWKSINFPHG